MISRQRIITLKILILCCFISGFSFVKAENAVISYQPFSPEASAEEISPPSLGDEVSPQIEKVETPEVKNIPLRFQLADPKGTYVEVIVKENIPEVKENESKPSEKLQLTKQEEVVVSEVPEKKHEKKKKKKKKKQKEKNRKEKPSFSKEDIKSTHEISSKKDSSENPNLKPKHPVSPPEKEEIEDQEEETAIIEPADENETAEIDYYLKKYKKALKGEANVQEYKHSLVEPFKQSLFYEVLKENKYETIELLTSDINADFKPEAIVSYNVPLGADGEYACQLMVLEPDEGGLNKTWVSELIPGEIDKVMVSDVNNDAQTDIVVVSTTGGVSLLKSIRIYSFNKSKNSFKTIFAMNGIMEGIVSVRAGKILISETFPGGINRAALYVWNGRRFERLEL